MDERLIRLHDSGIVAVIRLDDFSKAVPLTEALVAGGITAIEFTLTNPDAPTAIREVSQALKQKALIGAGTVLTPAQVEEVVAAGAQFIISPVMKPALITAASACHVISVIGAYTPTEIQLAWEAGADAVKVFPARNLGPNYIKDVLAPLPHLRLIPTGGISASNVGDYIRAGVFAIGAGGSLVDEKAIANDDWDSISRAAQAFTNALKAARA
jgi:2-dehydro-3-deoxyphosphogluconate aldolase/(4S)-4-hydroxy-2-oxoglutarate aldolase